MAGFIAIATFSWLTACTSGSASTTGKIDLCNFQLVFADEFRDLSISPHTLDGKRWTAHTPWNGDFGDAAFANPGTDGPFAIASGHLQIIASRDGAGRWRSGLIAASDASGQGSGVQFGYFEARMRLPPGPGTWPAFWLMSLKPADDASPNVEIDAIEYYGHDDAAFHATTHVWYKRPDQARSRHHGHIVPVEPRSLTSQFHDYGVRVDPQRITYYLDRKPVWREPTPPELKTPLYPLVDLALGSGFPIKDTPNPSVLAVEYVHVFKDDLAGRKHRCP